MTLVQQTKISHPNLTGSVIKTLIYFDVFSYPLTLDELLELCNYKNVTIEEGRHVLKQLVNLRLVNVKEGYFYLGNNKDKVLRRIKGNKLASKKIKTAKLITKIISFFPFTRGIFISGSLSKGYMDKSSDIDYFIITKPGRLWLCRTFLTLFKKIFLFNSRKNFCINYFVDTENLRIPDENIYTATETALVLPLFNPDIYKEYLKANSWIKNYYPNYKPKISIKKASLPFLKMIIEKIFDNELGDKLDDYFLNLSSIFWEKKFKNIDNGNSKSFLSVKNVSRLHPNHYDKSIMKKYKEKVNEFEQGTGIKLNF